MEEAQQLWGCKRLLIKFFGHVTRVVAMLFFCGVKVGNRASRLKFTGPAQHTGKFCYFLPSRIQSTLTNYFTLGA